MAAVHTLELGAMELELAESFLIFPFQELPASVNPFDNYTPSEEENSFTNSPGQCIGA